ncbi:branched-chain amino acid ABC transporter substrate-binding protein [Paraburkholderia bonniea]|uniref:branched-chain amino acid ABC transporter substrate-binding protein n=1 Tax=Paraburkholderia bonniea TaxID=2152891 RepID=UPI0015811483|nr:branched-chain amino acid ABC transporter substrate-binding protein [Paraburkholderia bonniea]WJF91649.1 branched-chain amino acid ABC transporter substrate-binding protein [Paraburkholderia bonniea]WJF94967.1 branched-chain amino acid ABC transporter substrate-binding protein [Paraburkholderia bonniea]
MKRFFSLSSAATLLAIGLTAAPGAFAASPQIIKIGFAAPLTGPSAADGKEMENATRLAIDDANRRAPKLNGQPVKFEIDAQDDQSDPRIATQIAQRFVDTGVAGVVGHFNTSCSIAASKTYSNASLAEISPSSTGASYTQQGYPTTFRVVGQDAIAGETLGRYLLDSLGAKRIAIIDDRTDFGQGLADRVEATLLKNHGKIVAREYVTNKTIDFSAVLTKIRGTNPDVIVFGGFDAQAAQLVRRMRSLGLKATLVGEGFNNNIFVDLARGDGEGTITIQPGLPADKLPASDFASRYEARFKTRLQGFQAPYAYDAATVLLNAVLTAGSAEPAKVLAAVKASRLKGVTGPLAFDAHGDLANSPYTVYRLKGSHWDGIKILNAAQ